MYAATRQEPFQGGRYVQAVKYLPKVSDLPIKNKHQSFLKSFLGVMNFRDFKAKRWFSIDALAEECARSRSWIFRVVHDLEAWGLIEREARFDADGWRRPSFFRVTDLLEDLLAAGRGLAKPAAQKIGKLALVPSDHMDGRHESRVPSPFPEDPPSQFATGTPTPLTSNQSIPVSTEITRDVIPGNDPRSSWQEGNLLGRGKDTPYRIGFPMLEPLFVALPRGSRVSGQQVKERLPGGKLFTNFALVNEVKRGICELYPATVVDKIVAYYAAHGRCYQADPSRRINPDDPRDLEILAEVGDAFAAGREPPALEILERRKVDPIPLVDPIPPPLEDGPTVDLDFEPPNRAADGPSWGGWPSQDALANSAQPEASNRATEAINWIDPGPPPPSPPPRRNFLAMIHDLVAPPRPKPTPKVVPAIAPLAVAPPPKRPAITVEERIAKIRAEVAAGLWKPEDGLLLIQAALRTARSG